MRLHTGMLFFYLAFNEPGISIPITARVFSL